MWLFTCTDYCVPNSWQWQEEAHRIRYAISRMEGMELSQFALTYRRQMTGELGYTRQAACKQWHVFAEQAVRRFGPTHVAQKCLKQMGFVKYHGNIAKFLLEMENLNIHARVTGIGWRQIIEEQIPEDALRRLSL